MIHRIQSLLLALFCAGTLLAIPPCPVPARFVADFANAFPDAQAVAELEEYLGSVSDSTGIQVQIVTVSSLEGEAPFMYARNIGEKWGVGDENLNNGVVILIKPRDADGGEVFIATGYGSECILTDAMCDEIIDRYMIDYLREENYFAAAEAAAHVCAEVMISGNSDLISTNYSSTRDSDEWDIYSWIGLSAILLPFLIGLLSWLSPRRRARDGIKYARTKKDLDKALLMADKCKLPEKDRMEAMAAMRANLYTFIQSAYSPSQQQEFIASVADMPLSQKRIEDIVAGMKELSYNEYIHCKSSSSLRSRLNRAIAFGNDAAALKAEFDTLLAALKVAEEAARKAAEERRREASYSSGHSSGSSYGGGHFGGGGAGRHF